MGLLDASREQRQIIYEDLHGGQDVFKVLNTIKFLSDNFEGSKEGLPSAVFVPLVQTIF